MGQLSRIFFKIITLSLFLLLGVGASAAGTTLQATCSTDGEGVDLHLKIGNGPRATLKGEFEAAFTNEEKIKFSADLNGNEVVDILSGKATAIVGRSSKSQATGGVVSDASLLAIAEGMNTSAIRGASLALNGNVYLLRCSLSVK